MIIGIDLGTTNSLVAAFDNEVTIIPNALGKMLTPSAISVDSGEIIVGEAALQRLITHPELTVINFKRLMGTDTITQLGAYKLRAEELSAFVLKRLKEDAEAYLQQPVTEAVISVPAYFSDAQRKATKLAGKLAGLKVERLINEPTAAGIAYGLHNQLDAADEINYLIVDIGGGTFDVSVLNLFAGIIEVRASGGDNYLGGVDFTAIIENIFIAAQQPDQAWQKIAELPKIKQRLKEEAERAKCVLSQQKNVTMQVDWQDQTFNCLITQEVFEEQAEHLIERLRQPIKKSLQDSKISPNDIHQIILVGGASRMPAVKKLIAKMFGRFPHCYLDPDQVVVQGVAIQAGLKSRNKALEELVVTDVAPYSLGVEVTDDLPNGRMHTYFDPIIERNTIVPFSRSRIYHVKEQQRKVEVKIYQGESVNIEKNVFLGELQIDLPAPYVVQEIDIRFTYDVNGLLEVEVTTRANQQKHTLIIEGNPGVLKSDEIENRLKLLAEIKMHPREKTENKLLLTKAERLFEELQGDERLYLSRAIKDFIAVLEEQDIQKIAVARKILIDLLDQLNSNKVW